VFVQRAGEAALRDGEATTQAFVARLAHARDLLHRRLNEIDGVEAVAPPGAMYAFFRIAGESDSLALCKRLVAEQGLGLAPGVAFGPGSEGFVRWCFAASDANLEEGVRRLRAGLKR
jgi:aspartate/methionine/tyrosine aminotransferase